MTPRLLFLATALAVSFPACGQEDAAASARLDWYVAAACEALGHESAMADAGPAIQARMTELGTGVVADELERVAAILAEETEADSDSAAFYCSERSQETRASYARPSSDYPLGAAPSGRP